MIYGQNAYVSMQATSFSLRWVVYQCVRRIIWRFLQQVVSREPSTFLQEFLVHKNESFGFSFNSHEQRRT